MFRTGRKSNFGFLNGRCDITGTHCAAGARMERRNRNGAKMARAKSDRAAHNRDGRHKRVLRMSRTRQKQHAAASHRTCQHSCRTGATAHTRQTFRACARVYCVRKLVFLSFLRAARVAGRPAVNSPRRSPHSQATFCDAADVWASPCETKLQRQSARVQRNDRSFVSGALGARQTAWLLRDGTRRAQLP